MGGNKISATGVSQKWVKSNRCRGGGRERVKVNYYNGQYLLPEPISWDRQTNRAWLDGLQSVNLMKYPQLMWPLWPLGWKHLEQNHNNIESCQELGWKWIWNKIIILVGGPCLCVCLVILQGLGVGPGSATERCSCRKKREKIRFFP